MLVVEAVGVMPQLVLMVEQVDQVEVEMELLDLLLEELEQTD
jgi:hypothetical protein